MCNQRSIALIGHRGCGKTTIGKELSLALGWLFLDQDLMIESQVFMKAGKALEVMPNRFRFLEESEIYKVPRVNCVFATGGGAVMNPVIFRWLQNHFFVIWLKAEEETLAKRRSSDSTYRPLLYGADSVLEEIRIAKKKRDLIYKDLCHFELNTDCHHWSLVVNRIIKACGFENF